jgi:uncharacterized protein YjbI with pentapeptide repeats
MTHGRASSQIYEVHLAILCTLTCRKPIISTASRLVNTLFSAFLLCVAYMSTLPALELPTPEPTAECDGPYKGKRPTPIELSKILAAHKIWLDNIWDNTSRRGGQQANLCGVDLADPFLRGNNWLKQADLGSANLQEAYLHGTNLEKAQLQHANLHKAHLVNANLYNAFLTFANLSGANLGSANLRAADIGGVNFQATLLDHANLEGASFLEANLREGDLSSANVQNAFLERANLQRAKLDNANLQKSNLQRANLEAVSLRGTDLQATNLSNANLTAAIFELKPGSLPDIPPLATARGLAEMTFNVSPHALVELREAFKKLGMRDQERQITYAIERTERHHLWESRHWSDNLEGAFKYLLFEFPCDYGMTPGRSLRILGGSIGLFSLVYISALLAAQGRAGIWAFWPADRVYTGEGEASPMRLTSGFIFPRLQTWAAGHWWGAVIRGLSILFVGLYFSILSAFSLGWRELNVGTWISRMQPREYILRATGWVRFVAGLQSLVSVYLLALWVLTYWGRPFE